MSSSTQLFMQVASSTGQIISDSFPMWYMIFGTGLAFIGLFLMLRAVRKSIKRMVRS